MKALGDISIRVAEASDVDLIHSALVALAAHTGAVDKMVSTPRDLLDNGFSGNPAFETLIAEVDGAFAGMCLSFASYSTWRGQKGIYVQDLYVADGFRGRKIGEALLKAAAARGRENGARYLRLSVDIDNKGAQAFYEKLGIVHSRDEQIHMIKGVEFDAFSQTETEQR